MNQSYLCGLTRRDKLIQKEHANMMDTITQHFIRVYRVPYFSPAIKEFSRRLEAYLRETYTLRLSYLDIYRIRSELHLTRAIRSRIKKHKLILRMTDKSGIFHLGNAKDYQIKAQTSTQ